MFGTSAVQTLFGCHWCERSAARDRLSRGLDSARISPYFQHFKSIDRPAHCNGESPQKCKMLPWLNISIQKEYGIAPRGADATLIYPVSGTQERPLQAAFFLCNLAKEEDACTQYQMYHLFWGFWGGFLEVVYSKVIICNSIPEKQKRKLKDELCIFNSTDNCNSDSQMHIVLMHRLSSKVGIHDQHLRVKA